MVNTAPNIQSLQWIIDLQWILDLQWIYGSELGKLTLTQFLATVAKLWPYPRFQTHHPHFRNKYFVDHLTFQVVHSIFNYNFKTNVNKFRRMECM